MPSRGINLVFAVIVVIAVLFAGCTENISSSTSQPFTKEDLTIPRAPSTDPHADDWVPSTVGFPPATGINFSLLYTSTVAIYENWSSAWEIHLKNSGEKQLFVFDIRMNVSFNATGFKLTANKIVEPGSEGDLGIMGIAGPSFNGSANFSFEVSFAQINDLGTWSRAPLYTTSTHDMSILPLPALNDVERISNYDQYYSAVNTHVAPAADSVYVKSRQIASAHPGTYNIYQVLDLFEWVHHNISYVSDPVNREQWQLPDIILAAGAGDCDDFSILFCSFVTSIGGTVRMHLTNSHAFCSLYVGNSTDLANMTAAIRAYYRSDVPVTWLADDFGYWIMADPTSSMHLGALPYHAVPAATAPPPATETAPAQQKWGFDSATDTFISIDVIPQTQ